MLLQNLQAEIADAIVSDDHYTDVINPLQNISIYHNNVISSLINTLKEIYPLIVKLVGEDFFLLTAKEYIKKYPSRSGDLHTYGEYFSDFLAHYQPLKDLAYISEVAQFEWICHTLYFAASHDALNIRALENISPDQYDHLHLILHPASKVIKFYFPILKIIDLCKNEIKEINNINEGGVHLLIIRRELDISLVPLTAGEFTFLDMLQDNKTLSEALNTALMLDPTFNLESKLPLWAQDKTIVDVIC